jgi:hypothetical protein
MTGFMKVPCPQCPFREDVKPYLHPERAADLAYSTQNKYNSFACHKTTQSADDDSGRMLITTTTKQCAGFLTMQHTELGETFFDDQGFEPSKLIYCDAYDMAAAYEEEHGAKS